MRVYNMYIYILAENPTYRWSFDTPSMGHSHKNVYLVHVLILVMYKYLCFIIITDLISIYLMMYIISSVCFIGYILSFLLLSVVYRYIVILY